MTLKIDTSDFDNLNHNIGIIADSLLETVNAGIKVGSDNVAIKIAVYDEFVKRVDHITQACKSVQACLWDVIERNRNNEIRSNDSI